MGSTNKKIWSLTCSTSFLSRSTLFAITSQHNIITIRHHLHLMPSAGKPLNLPPRREGSQPTSHFNCLWSMAYTFVRTYNNWNEWQSGELQNRGSGIEFGEIVNHNRAIFTVLVDQVGGRERIIWRGSSVALRRWWLQVWFLLLFALEVEEFMEHNSSSDGNWKQSAKRYPPPRSPKGEMILGLNWSHDQQNDFSAFIGYNCCSLNRYYILSLTAGREMDDLDFLFHHLKGTTTNLFWRPLCCWVWEEERGRWARGSVQNRWQRDLVVNDW